LGGEESEEKKKLRIGTEGKKEDTNFSIII
jgi:hypothetical protein